MFAETDAFWKWPSVYDVLTVGGLALGIASIWYAWYLARRQLRADLDRAAAEAVDVLSRFVLGGDLAEAVRLLKEAQRYLSDRKWELGLVRMDDATSAISRFSEHLRLDEKGRHGLMGILNQLGEIGRTARSHSRSPAKKSHLPAEPLNRLPAIVIDLERLRGRLMTTMIAPSTGGSEK